MPGFYYTEPKIMTISLKKKKEKQKADNNTKNKLDYNYKL